MLEIIGKSDLTIANTSRFSQNGNSSHTRVLDVLDSGNNFSAFIRHSSLATIHEKLKIAIADIDVRWDKGASTTTVVACAEASGESSRLECEDSLVGELSLTVNDVLAVLVGRLRGALQDIGLGNGCRQTDSQEGGSDGGDKMHDGLLLGWLVAVDLGDSEWHSILYTSISFSS